MAPSLWERILLAFQYNDALWHNVFLTILYVLAGLSLLILLRLLVRSIARPRDIRDEANAPARKGGGKLFLGWLIGTLGVLGFPLVLFVILSVALGGADSARIDSGTLSYEQGGVETSVVLVDKFIANSTGEGITTGSSKAFVYAINVADGDVLWKTGIGRSTSPFLFGQTEDRVILFDGTGPVVLSKADGAQLADTDTLEAANAELQGKFPEEAPRYKWDDTSKTLVFQGLDGGLYSVNPDTLKGSAAADAKLDDYFGEDSSENRYISATLGLIGSGEEDGRYMLLLNEENAEALQEGTYGQGESSTTSTEDSRRRLYAGSLLAGGALPAKDLEPLLDQVFLNGAILSDPSVDGSASPDPYVMTEFPDYTTLKKQPEMPESPSFDWPSRMTMEEYERKQAEYDQRMDAYYKARDQYDADNEAYRDSQSRYDATARALLRLNASSAYPPFHFTDAASGNETFLILHDAVLSNDTNMLLSAVDPKAGKVLWTADTHLQSVDHYSRSGDHLVLVGRGDGGNSYLFTVTLKDGRSWGYDFKYDQTVEF